MKKNTKPTDRKRTIAVCGLSALCIAVLAGAYFLAREPEREFIPASAELADVTDTWGEKSGTDAILPDASAKESSQIQGTASDIWRVKLSLMAANGHSGGITFTARLPTLRHTILRTFRMTSSAML